MHYFVVNPLSGAGKGARYGEEIKKLLEEKALPFVMRLTEYAGHATLLTKELCALPDCTALVAVGGDGTFGEVLNGMDLKIPLGLIPSGTGNDFGRTIGLRNECGAALEDVLHGQAAPADFIDVNGFRSLNVSGTGFDVDLSRVAFKLRKFIKGSVTYYISLLYTLLVFPFRPARIIVDGEKELHTPIMLVAAANGRKYGGGLPIAPQAEIDDGLMDLVIIKKVPRYKIPYLLLQFLKGKLLELTRYVEFYRCKTMECILEKEDIELNIDGELLSKTPMLAKICPGALQLIRPFDKI